MRVLVVWKEYFHYLPGIANAFNEIPGVIGKYFTMRYFMNHAKGYEKFATKKGIKYFQNKFSGDIRAMLIAECKKYKPDLIVFLNADYSDIINEELFAFMKNQHIKSAIWFVDSIRKLEGYSSEYLSQFNGIYSFDYEDINYIKQEYAINHTQYLPLGADSAVYNANNGNSTQKKHDVFFVGGVDTKRLEVLESVATYCSKNNRDMIVYGDLWKQRPIWRRIRHERKFKVKYPNLYRFAANVILAPKDVARIYSKSKICLNIVRASSVGANPRTFEILGAKSMQMIDYSERLEMLFEDRKHLVMYKNTAELEKLLDYYLNNDEERENIAQAGYELVMEKYTMKKLVEKIVADMK